MKKINLSLSAVSVAFCSTIFLYGCASAPNVNLKGKMIKQHGECYVAVTLKNIGNKPLNISDALKIFLFDSAGNQIADSIGFYIRVAGLGVGKSYMIEPWFVAKGEEGDRICNSVSRYKFYL